MNEQELCRKRLLDLVLPFEEAYYGGGANDIRAWQARTLGPGSYLATELYYSVIF